MSASPRTSDGVLGHADAERQFTQAWHAGRLHHAWLLTGPGGIGKATLAYRFARLVLGGGDPKGAARRIAAATHADLLVIERAVDEKRQRQRTEIVVDDVRPISSFLRRTAAEGGWRVVIVDGAEYLNRHAANALLKLLEEPPGQALILLVSSAPGRLLPTIRSRCRGLRLRPLDPATMHLALDRLLPDMAEQERQILIDLSDGSPGRAIALAADDGIALYGMVRRLLSQPDRAAGLWGYELADAVLRHDNGFSTFIGLLCTAISTTIRVAVRGGTEPAGTDLLSTRPPDYWAAACEELTRLGRETESLNLDKRQALLTGLSLLSG